MSYYKLAGLSAHLPAQKNMGRLKKKKKTQSGFIGFFGLEFFAAHFPAQSHLFLVTYL